VVLRAVPGVPEIRLHLLDGPLEDHWERLGALPYWGHPWPGGQALARHVLDHPGLVTGRRVLDLAAGSGLVAIAAALAGAARVTAADIDPLARSAIARNATTSAVALTVEAADLLDGPPTGHDVVLAGDVCYEPEFARRALAFAHRAAEAGALVLLGDPGRTYCRTEGLTALARLDVPTPGGAEERSVTRTTVWRVNPRQLRS
jgi:predicted nicotinamide N-methyase